MVGVLCLFTFFLRSTFAAKKNGCFFSVVARHLNHIHPRGQVKPRGQAYKIQPMGSTIEPAIIIQTPPQSSWPIRRVCCPYRLVAEEEQLSGLCRWLRNASGVLPAVDRVLPQMVPPPCFPTPPNQCSVAEMKICIFLVLLFYEFVSVSSYVFFMLFEFCWELTGIYEKSAFSTNLPCYQTLVYFSHAFVFDFKHFFLFYMDHPKKHHEVQAILLDLLRFFFFAFLQGDFFLCIPLCNLSPHTIWLARSTTPRTLFFCQFVVHLSLCYPCVHVCPSFFSVCYVFTEGKSFSVCFPNWLGATTNGGRRSNDEFLNPKIPFLSASSGVWGSEP